MKYLQGIALSVLAVFAIVLFAPAEKEARTLEPEQPASVLDAKMEPAEHFFLQRSYPDPALDLPAYEAALKAAAVTYSTNKTQSSSGVTTTPWTVQGPHNIGGRINAIAIDPNNANTILVGAAAGGIFKTTDGGSNWTPVFDDHSYLGIGDITYQPGSSQIIYAGTGDPNISGYPVIGDGIYKSTDAGNTWTHLGLTNTRVISRIIVDPNNVNKIYVATMGLPMQRNNDRGLYISSDGGTTWTQSLFVADQAGIIDLQMDPNATGTLYASSWDRIRTNQESTVFGTNAKVWKTTNGGSTWAPLTNGLPSIPMSRINLSIDPTSPSTVYACFVDSTYNVFNIYKTTNSGSSWAPMDISSLNPNALGGFGWYFGNIFVNPFQANEIYVLGVQLYRTTDGGINWNEVDPPWWQYDVHADKHDMVFTGPNSFYLATDGGLYYTPDDGGTWTDVDLIPNTQFYRVAVNPHNPGVYYGGAQDNGTTSGNSSTINNWNRIYGGDGFQVLFTNNSQEIVAETQNGNLVYSDDGGNYWNGFDFGLDSYDRRNWDMPVAVSPTSSTTFYTGTYRVYRNTTGLSGHNWQPISPDLTDGVIFGDRYHTLTTIGESPIDPLILYAGASDGNVNVTSNGGTNWTNISAGLPKRYVTSIKASPHLTDEALLTVSGYKYNDYIPHLLHTTDKGANWVDVSGDLPQLALNDVLFHPTLDSVWVVASDGGVYVSQNFGQNWLRVGNNMPVCPVYDMEWDMALQRLVAGTHARSLQTFPMDSLIDIDIIIGLPDPMGLPSIKLYPNPADEYLVFEQKMESGNPFTWEVLNLNGQSLIQGRQTQPAQRIDVNHLPSGAYFLRTNSGSKTATVKFLKR
jgi:photosystem II stability/assembly factor-like uncharacterized protein